LPKKRKKNKERGEQEERRTVREENKEKGEQGKRRAGKKENKKRGEQGKRSVLEHEKTEQPVPVHLTTRPSLLRPRWKFVVWGHCRCRGTLARTTPARKREKKREKERTRKRGVRD
jgi:hypothetical protein